MGRLCGVRESSGDVLPNGLTKGVTSAWITARRIACAMEYGHSTDVVGLITNNGSRKWSNVTIEAEFFDGAGVFLDEQSSFVRAEIPAGAKEHFKISLRPADLKLKAEDTKMVVKVAGGHTMPF